MSFVTGPGAAAIPPENFVLPSPPPATLTVLESTPDRLLFNVTSGRDSGDINQGDVAARVFYTVDPAAGPGTYRILFDPNFTVFSSSNPNFDPLIFADATDAGVIFVPEPSGLALLAAAGVLTLRRRARA